MKKIVFIKELKPYTESELYCIDMSSRNQYSRANPLRIVWALKGIMTMQSNKMRMYLRLSQVMP